MTSLCSATSQTVAWTAQIQPTASTLTIAGIAAGPTNDVVVADRSGGTVFEQHRWSLVGMDLGVHQDAMGAYAGSVSLGGTTLPASNDTFLAVLDTTGNLRWDKTVTVGSSGALIAASGPCGLALATNSTTVNLGAGPLSTVTPPAPPTIGVATLAF